MNALQREDLAEAMRWLLKRSEPVSMPHHLVYDSWNLSSTDLYGQARNIDARSHTAYSAQLDEITKRVKNLADAYRVREQAGLVVIVENHSVATTLREAGFNIRFKLSEPFRNYSLLNTELTPSYHFELEKRKVELDLLVDAIMDEKAAMVLSPLNPRIFPLSEPRNPLMEAEGVTIYQGLKEKAFKLGLKEPPFFVLAQGDNQMLYLGRKNIPYLAENDSVRLREAAKKRLM
ncbi:hypothetical protein HYX05_05485 [Candidatus Woesearchaeota archaeon]|nr:hypothetical protein [Candidatus Woesearchaeota archaeon]